MILRANRNNAKDVFFISVLARKQLEPTDLMRRMASSTVAYETLVWSGEIPSFNEEPLGNERW